MALLIVRHFAEPLAQFWRRLLFPFIGFQMENQLHCSLASVTRKKENDNDENGGIRDCLAESETTSASATPGADYSGFSDRSLFGSGIHLHPRGIFLGHDI